MRTDDRKLILAFQTGDRRAFDRLFQRYAARVVAFARQLTGSQADAEDLTQETFVAALRGLEQFGGHSSLLTWLLAITTRHWRDQQRHKQPSTCSLVEYEARGEVVLLNGNPDCLADRVASGIALQEALAALDLPLREAFLLVAMQGLTHREAAAVLESPVGTIKWRVAEAVRRLRILFQQNEERRQEDVSTVRA